MGLVKVSHFSNSKKKKENHTKTEGVKQFEVRGRVRKLCSLFNMLMGCLSKTRE